MRGSAFDLIWSLFEERFWKKVDVGNLDDCWLWTASVGTDGYGRISVGGRGGKLMSAHRIAYELEHGRVPKGKWVLHKCDNKLCVNPKHLYSGTHTDNMNDFRFRGTADHDPQKWVRK